MNFPAPHLAQPELALRFDAVRAASREPGHIRPTYRNFFPSPARWQFAGVRLARDPR